MEKRIFISLPDTEQRRELLKINLKALQIAPDVDMDEVARQMQGYSGDDCSNVCRDAAMNGMRRMMIGKSREEIQAMNKSDIAEPVRMDDFIQVTASPRQYGLFGHCQLASMAPVFCLQPVAGSRLVNEPCLNR